MDDALTIKLRTDFGLASIMARKSCGDDDLATFLGISLAPPGQCISNTRLTLISTGPRAWLAFADSGESGFAANLSDRLAGNASVSDQSSGYAIFEISGTKARKLLQRGAPVDLHPAAFPPGSVATTVIAHIGVILWQPYENDTFNVAVFRSYRTSFEHWLEAVAASL